MSTTLSSFVDIIIPESCWQIRGKDSCINWGCTNWEKVIIYSSKWCNNNEKLKEIKIKIFKQNIRKCSLTVRYMKLQFLKRGGGTLIAWSTWNYTGREMLKILESVCAWTGKRTEWPFPSFMLWILKMILLRDFNIHVKNYTYLFWNFQVFSFFFIFLISMEMSLNILADTLFISLNSFFSLLILHLAYSDH